MDQDRGIKDSLYGQLADVAKALAVMVAMTSTVRGAWARRSRSSSRCGFGISVASASQHLRTMRDATKSGSFITYRLAHRDVAALLMKLRGLEEAHRHAINAVVRTIRADDAHVEVFDQSDLMKRMERVEVILLDVRPAEEFAAAHVRGAVSIALEDLKQRLKGAAEVKEARGVLPRAVQLARERGGERAQECRLRCDADARGCRRVARARPPHRRADRRNARRSEGMSDDTAGLKLMFVTADQIDACVDLQSLIGLVKEGVDSSSQSRAPGNDSSARARKAS